MDELKQQEQGQPQDPVNYKQPIREQFRINAIADIDFSRTYSYADYFRWGFEERLELIKGRIFRISPAPSLTHQRLCGLIYVKLYAYLSDKTGEAFVSPFDVRLPAVSMEDEAIFTVVQPDVCVICDAGKLDERGCMGAPDLIVEVLSPGNNKKELIDKFTIYEEAQVKEYWVINPEKKIVIIYHLNGKGRFQEAKDPVSAIFPDFKLNVTELFRI